MIQESCATRIGQIAGVPWAADLLSMRNRRPPYTKKPAAAMRETTAMKQQDRTRETPLGSGLDVTPEKIQSAICRTVALSCHPLGPMQGPSLIFSYSLTELAKSLSPRNTPCL